MVQKWVKKGMQTDSVCANELEFFLQIAVL